jgi:hypothetical protein
VPPDVEVASVAADGASAKIATDQVTVDGQPLPQVIGSHQNVVLGAIHATFDLARTQGTGT